MSKPNSEPARCGRSSRREWHIRFISTAHCSASYPSRERRRRLISISFGRARSLAFVTGIIRKLSLGLFPEMLAITSDQVKLLRSDNIVSPHAEAEGRTLRGLGIAPEPFETFVPSYLYRYRKTGQFTGTRAV